MARNLRSALTQQCIYLTSTKTKSKQALTNCHIALHMVTNTNRIEWNKI